jgi:Vacuolar 14 Fab1-binding region
VSCVQDYALSPQANQRKGGLLCLAAAAVGLGDAGSAHLQTIVPPVLDSFTDQDSRVRYYACEVTCATLLCVSHAAAGAATTAGSITVVQAAVLICQGTASV